MREKYLKKLLVEGNDDKHVIWALCEKYALHENFDIVDCKGVERLMEQIPVRFKASEVDTVGMVVDADMYLQSRWDSIRYKLSGIGFDVPKDLPSEGLILKNGTFKVGVWIMPDNNLKGMLEDFLSFLIPEHDKLKPVVQDILSSIEERKLNKYSENSRSKAFIHTWLAWQEDPGTPMGSSITKRYLTTEQEVCMKFVMWLKTLFADD